MTKTTTEILREHAPQFLALDNRERSEKPFYAPSAEPFILFSTTDIRALLDDYARLLEENRRLKLGSYKLSESEMCE